MRKPARTCLWRFTARVRRPSGLRTRLLRIPNAARLVVNNPSRVKLSFQNDGTDETDATFLWHDDLVSSTVGWIVTAGALITFDIFHFDQTVWANSGSSATQPSSLHA